jgi:hypothetical protein
MRSQPKDRRLSPATLDRLAAIIDVLTLPLTYVAAWHLKMLRKYTLPRFPRAERALHAVGVYPLIDHYYEPLIRTDRLSRPIQKKRHLPGLPVDLETTGRNLIDLLNSAAPSGIPDTPVPPDDTGIPTYHYSNATFGPVDAHTLYAIIRKHKPRRLIEIGCGMSTLVARKAITDEQAASPDWTCHHTAVEPYENNWLESLGVEVMRAKVEECEPSYFDSLKAGDVLFIDCSHIIRPQGEVTYLVQEVLGRLAPGVVVHIHDIFTPYDYPDSWLETHGLFWNEQYLVEAFLAFNPDFEILYPVSALWLEHEDALVEACPPAGRVRCIPPTSFWICRKG